MEPLCDAGDADIKQHHYVVPFIASSPLVLVTPAAFCFSCQHWKT